ncbi:MULTISPECIES: 20S proteasome subunit A/B [Halomonadaceae]|uniref:20S proteasome subunit A/B n=2 Tax=Halomonadaceae TaxID=28256 RepID=A0ABS6ZHY9_9GAMM|nr:MULTISPECIES: 20S proteasome subunit A/B [Halomonas]MBW6389667.1 20S proteasome subunit A/B [Halomonas antri]QTP59986.1 20S proteasome subunit A/B [Halomonas sulfidivorans]
MTTIVWDGTTLATDSLISVNGSTYNHAQKLFQLDSGEWVAFAGEQQEWWEVMEWLNAGAPRNDKPHVTRVEMIIAGPDGVFEMFNKLVRIPVSGPVAYGTGWKWALAAIDHGKSAIEAVEYAKTRDHDTGGEVQSVTPATRAGMPFETMMRDVETEPDPVTA